MNIHAPHPSRSQDYRFTDDDFRIIADFAKSRFGLDLQTSKKPLVYSRLAKRLRALGLNDFSQYCSNLLDEANATEISHLLSALTTNVTHFFREKHHFDYLADVVTPQIFEKAKSGESIRLWSAACSAGQEAYCIAATLLKAKPEIARLNLRILATDIDPKMIAHAKVGRYDNDQKSAIPTKMQSLMLTKDAHGEALQIAQPLRDLISFAELNLIDSWPMRKSYDVIFCRNVAIYFDKATQADLWQRFAQALKPGGHLIIGHSERLSGPAMSQFRSAGVTTYIKNTPTI